MKSTYIIPNINIEKLNLIDVITASDEETNDQSNENAVQGASVFWS